VLHKINVSDPVLAAPVAAMSLCLRVGGLDVKDDFVLKLA
jgi:hypothetical protein